MAQSRRLLAATLRILRPLVRILIRHGVPYPVFSDLARWMYVDVAARDFGLSGRKQTNSRISVVTGLSRKEVLRLRRLSVPSDEDSVDRFHRAARIITAWVREPEFRGTSDAPAALPFEGDGASFSELVRRHGGDVTPRAVLDELLRVGVVERDEEGQVRLQAQAYVPTGSAGEEEKLSILGADVAALISTIDHNLTAEPAARFFQRKVEYWGVPAVAVPEIRAVAAEKGQPLLELLDRLLAERIPQEPQRVPETKRVMLGIYWWEEGETDDESGSVPPPNSAQR